MTVRVLVVDDHPGFLATARRMLEADGWLVIGEAGDGASALSAAHLLQPDLVLLDIGLPDIDGFEVAERLASSKATCVVLVSSRDGGAYGDRISSSPAAGFIAKGELDGDRLRELVARHRARIVS